MGNILVYYNVAFGKEMLQRMISSASEENTKF